MVKAVVVSIILWNASTYSHTSKDNRSIFAIESVLRTDSGEVERRVELDAAEGFRKLQLRKLEQLKELEKQRMALRKARERIRALKLQSEERQSQQLEELKRAWRARLSEGK